MAGDDDDLRLNTLHRFAKHSPRLVLHEYAHCEIPAGCGGVVMRWYDPATGAPGMVKLEAFGGDGTLWLDGEPLASSLVHLRAGAHVIAVHLQPEATSEAAAKAPAAAPAPRPFVLGVMYEADLDRDLISSGAARWCCTATRPPEGWTAPGFPDAAWSEVPRPPAGYLEGLARWPRYAIEQAAQRGQPVFDFRTDELWLRVAFTAAAARRAGGAR